jgi:hypothetical protein
VSIREAIIGTEHLYWDRNSERFRRSFNLARRLLMGTGHMLRSGGADTFVFLIDMNAVFEQFLKAALEAAFHTRIETQHFLGTLLQLPVGGILQRTDFTWRSCGRDWVADAKYKHLAAGHADSLTFSDIADERLEARPFAARVISPDDVRQLTVYGELRKKQSTGTPVSLAIIYPFVGNGLFEAANATTWSGVDLHLVPVRVTEPTSRNLADVFPVKFVQAVSEHQSPSDLLAIV